MKIRRLSYVIAVVVCVAIGALGGIASGSAATSHHRTRGSQAKAATSSGQAPAGGGPPAGPPAIHSVSVVPNKEGTGFDTVTTDSGTVQSVSGQQLTITEGTKSATYQTVTLTIPAGATVQLDGKSATLSELQSGDRVTVSENSDGTSTVSAGDASFMPTGAQGGGMPPSQGHGGPPPQGAEG
jgi:hypothetical protein